MVVKSLVLGWSTITVYSRRIRQIIISVHDICVSQKVVVPLVSGLVVVRLRHVVGGWLLVIKLRLRINQRLVELVLLNILIVLLKKRWVVQGVVNLMQLEVTGLAGERVRAIEKCTLGAANCLRLNVHFYY